MAPPPEPVVAKLPPVFAEDTAFLTHSFRVVNNTQKPLLFRQIVRTCACSESTLDKCDLQPGEETRLHLKTRLKGQFGRQTFSLPSVIDEATPPWIYQVEVDVYQRARFDPDSLRFGFLKPKVQREKQATLELYSRAADAPFTCLQISSASEQVTAKAGEMTRAMLPDDIRVQRWPLTIVLAPQSSAGRATSQVIVRYQQGEAVYESYLPVSWAVRSHYRATPARLFFGVVDPSSPGELEREIVVHRTDGKPFILRSLRATDPEVECVRASNAASERQQLTVRFKKTPKVSSSGEVILETDDPEEEVIRIPFGVFRKPS